MVHFERVTHSTRLEMPPNGKSWIAEIHLENETTPLLYVSEKKMQDVLIVDGSNDMALRQFEFLKQINWDDPDAIVVAWDIDPPSANKRDVMIACRYEAYLTHIDPLFSFEKQ